MQQQDYKIVIAAEVSSQEAFETINSVSSWWTADLEGSSQKLNDEFTVRFGDVHVSTQKIIEVIPAKKVLWLVTDSRLNFIEDKQEWTNTTISFDIAEQGNKTFITFTHMGLVPGLECYSSCIKGWDHYIKGSLFNLLAEGKGNPASKKVA